MDPQKLAIVGVGLVVIIVVGLAAGPLAAVGLVIIAALAGGAYFYYTTSTVDTQAPATPTAREPKTWQVNETAIRIIVEKTGLAQPVVEKIVTDFSPADRQYVIERIERYQREERDQVHMSVLEMSAGNRDKVAYYVEKALKDYQAILAGDRS